MKFSRQVLSAGALVGFMVLLFGSFGGSEKEPTSSDGEPVDELGGVFSPLDDPGLITQVRGLTVRENPCATPQLGEREWPASLLPDPHGTFFSKVRTKGAVATHGSYGPILFELDPEFVVAALQIAQMEQQLSHAELQRKIALAREQLFVDHTRTVVLVYHQPHGGSFYGVVPTLISEAQGEGRLVRLSMNAARELVPGTLVLMTFEDRVCLGDGSYLIDTSFRDAANIKTARSYRFVIPSEGQAPAQLYEIFSDYRPSLETGSAVGFRDGGVGMHHGEKSASIKLALEIAGLVFSQ
jgi:hypothetical protein